MKGYIYKITSPTGKIYIGQTKNLKRRIYRYKTNDCKKQVILYNSLLKYGFDKHKMEVIDECVYCGNNNWLLNMLEIYWINELKTNSNLYKNGLGMNLNDGGCGNSGFSHSEKTKQLLREKNIGKKHTNVTKEKLSMMFSGEKHPQYGKPKSETSIIKDQKELIVDQSI